jgi:hypothetical protein
LWLILLLGAYHGINPLGAALLGVALPEHQREIAIILIGQCAGALGIASSNCRIP